MLKIVNLCVTNPLGNKFLFLKRSKHPFKDYLGMFGGKIEEGEDVGKAASRELFEESGILGEGKFFGKCHEKIIENGNLIYEFNIYFFHFVVDEKVSFNPGCEGDIKWISVEEFDKNKLIPSDPLMIGAFLNKGFKELISVIEKKGEEYFQKKFEEPIVERVRKFVEEECYNGKIGFGKEYFDIHFSIVVKFSKLLAEKLNADKEIVEIAGWLHDMGSVKYGQDNHHIIGAKIAEEKLLELGYPSDKIENVKHCILAHRGSQSIPRKTIEAQILADADSMAHFESVAGLFKYFFIKNGMGPNQYYATDFVRTKLINSYNKLSPAAKEIIKPRFDAAMLLLGENNNIKSNSKKVGAGVGVMILKDGKVLLGKRHFDKEKADSELRGEGTWTMPGGKIEFGEGFEKCAIREVREETGLILNKVKVICVNNDKNEYAHFITIGLFSDDFTGNPQVMEPDEITEWRWFDLDDLPSPIFFPSMNLIKNYKQNKFYIP